MSTKIELAELIAALRLELSVASEEGEGELIRFRPGPVELELTLEVTREAGPEAKIRFWVLEGGVSAKRSDVVTQRLKLVLDPVRGDLAPGTPWVSGPSMPGEE